MDPWEQCILIKPKVLIKGIKMMPDKEKHIIHAGLVEKKQMASSLRRESFDLESREIFLYACVI